MKLDNMEKQMIERIQFLICIIIFINLLYINLSINLWSALGLILFFCFALLGQALDMKRRYLLTYLYLFLDNYTVNEGANITDRDTIT